MWKQHWRNLFNREITWSTCEYLPRGRQYWTHYRISTNLQSIGSAISVLRVILEVFSITSSHIGDRTSWSISKSSIQGVWQYSDTRSATRCKIITTKINTCTGSPNINIKKTSAKSTASRTSIINYTCIIVTSDLDNTTRVVTTGICTITRYIYTSLINTS